MKKVLTLSAQKLRNNPTVEHLEIPLPNPPHKGEGIPIRFSWGQVTLEFTFSMILVLLLMYGVIRVLIWTSLTLAERRATHDYSLTARIDENWKSMDSSPLLQLAPEFYATNKMGLVYNSW